MEEMVESFQENLRKRGYQPFDLGISPTRRAFWRDNYLAFQQGDSLMLPPKDYLSYFENKEVLEIGPGEGRQFDVVKKASKSYSVADIVHEILKHKKYATCKNKFYIKTYADNYDKQFDVVHFWYVFHHVKVEERLSFFRFVHRHLRQREGYMLFNTPVNEYPDPAYGDDGILTTRCELEDINALLNRNFTWEADSSRYGNSNGYIVVAKAK